MTDQRGFTLIEMLIALTILAIVALGMATSTGQFVRIVADAEIQMSAIQLADERVQMVLMDPDYGNLETTYNMTEGSFPGLSGFQRATTIVHVGGSGQTTDHKLIQVIVSGPGLAQSVKRSVTMAAP